MSTIEGHTIFSLYSDQIQVYEQLHKQLREKKYPNQESIEGTWVENSYLGRLMQLLLLPVTDLKRRQPSYDAGRIVSYRKCCKTIKEFPRDTGFKSIIKKSVYFTNIRFRDILIEILTLSEQSTIAHLVDNLDDIKRLMDNTSPVLLESFESAFVQTNYCRRTKHVFMS